MEEFLINPVYVENTKKLQRTFSQAKPFKHLILPRFLKPSDCKAMRKEVEKQSFYVEDHDLYQFLRTQDVKHLQNAQTLKKLKHTLLSKRIRAFMQEVTQTTLNTKKMDLHALKLLNTHYLLCHNDEVQGRKIAFILNLTTNWKKGKGGELELFSSEQGRPLKPEKSIRPRFNTFTLFEVSHNSYHQIVEVEKNLERISLSGWYYTK